MTKFPNQETSSISQSCFETIVLSQDSSWDNKTHTVCVGQEFVFLKISFSWGSVLLAFLFLFVNPYQLGILLTQTKRRLVSLKIPLWSFRAPCPGTSGKSRWSGWFAYKWFTCRSPLPRFPYPISLLFHTEQYNSDQEN